jgi:predicted transcriptional regulator
MNKITTGRDIMVTKVWQLRPDQSALEGVAWLLKHQITGAPVVEDRFFRGMFSEKCSLSLFSAAATGLSSQTGRAVEGPNVLSFAARDVTTLRPEEEVFDAIGKLLQSRISGAPVVDSDGRFLGIFSEKTSMDVLMRAAYDQLPSTTVGNFMDTDRDRVISEDMNLWSVAGVFASTRYRRLLVLRAGRVIGQVSRRDVLRAGYPLLNEIHQSCRVQLRPPRDANEADSEVFSLLDASVGMSMDVNARTIRPEADWMEIASVFNHTNYRRLQVLDPEGRLLGQISRRDLLNAVFRMLDPKQKRHEQLPLYLSAIRDRASNSFS